MSHRVARSSEPVRRDHDAVEHSETFTLTRDRFAAGSANAPLIDLDRFRADLDDAFAGEADDRPVR
ncbi:Hypothetical protein AJAP_24900 [Amycolatopsis japonica]|uniref:Uncharacterized protein n=1 Tax=Amycolatopsis japonica TaxID=208439 RepID=A0A075UXV9_9PSEU|nr:hypothetical protein [Amycolatopsis japonica]AIG77828.1 Hypothetical protein AJAP_24900 [Amycolatopsis japonica]